MSTLQNGKETLKSPNGLKMEINVFARAIDEILVDAGERATNDVEQFALSSAAAFMFCLQYN